MIGILKDEPRNKYVDNNLESHTCVYKFIVALDISGVSKEAFDVWCDDIATRFITRNMMPFPIKECDEIPGVMINTRSFIEIA